MSGTYRCVNPLAIMQVQNGSGGNWGPCFRLLPVERGSNEHAHAHRSWIRHFEPNLRSTEAGIENRQDVIDPPFADMVGIGVQPDIRVLTDVHRVEIVLVNVTDDPDIRQIRDGEGIGRAQSLHARRVCNLLVSDHARYWCDDVDNSRRMVLIDAEKPQL